MDFEAVFMLTKPLSDVVTPAKRREFLCVAHHVEAIHRASLYNGRILSQRYLSR